jgi:hypothetical protein
MTKRLFHCVAETAGHVHTAIWILESVGGGTLLATVLGFIQKNRSQVDWVAIGLMFLVATFVIGAAIWLALYKRREPASDPTAPPEISPWENSAELREFNMLSNDFSELKWIQRAALAQLWRMTSCPFDSLCNLLVQQGFGMEVPKIVSPLCQSKFIETTQGRAGLDLCIHPARKKEIRRLLEQWKASVL